MQGESLPSRYPGGERAVNAEWLQRRESAFVVVRADYETQRAQAQADYYASGVGSASGDGSGGDPGFDENAFRSQYVAQLASRAAGSGPLRTALQTLGECYGSDAATLLGSRTALLDELVRTASSDHALNAGPAPSGIAMGDAGGLAMLDFYLADAQIRTLIDTYGGPTPARDPLALEQVRLLGPTRFEQLMRLHNAMGHVRWLYTHAMTQAERSGQGPGWVDRVHTVVEGSSVEGESTSVATDGPTTTRTVVEHVFDHDAFTAWYIAQPGTANRAFRDFYGASHTAAVPGAPGESGQSSGPPSFTQRFDNPAWVMADGAMNRDGLEQLNINDPPQLNDRSAVFFDLEAGWVTPQGNVHENNTLETVVGVIFVVAVSYVSFNTLGPWAVEAVGLAGSGGGAAASIGVAGASYATTSTAAAMVTAGITGAAAATASGLVNGNVTLRDVLRGALSGALSAGLLQGLNTALPDLGAVGTIGARMTIQGGIQALLGGHFRDGAIAAFASGLAQLTTDSMNAGIADALREGTMSPEQAYAARSLVRVIGSAVRAAGNPSDPLHAFASDFLGELLQQAGAPDDAGSTPGGQTPPATSTAFDDEGNLMPGITSAAAPWDQQLRDVYAHLIAQGMDAASAQGVVADYDERLQSEAFVAFVDAQPEPHLVAGVGATPEIRSARDVMESIERRMADGTLRGGDIGTAINEAHDAFLRLGQAAERAPTDPSRDDERVASRLLSMISDLGRLAEQTGATLSPQQTALVRQAQVADWNRFWSTAGEAAGVAMGPLALRRSVALNRWQLAANLRASGQLPPTSTGYEAHHIVPFGASRASNLRARLSAVGIDINDARNGIWLRTSGTAGTTTPHNETMRWSYYDVFDRRFAGCTTQSDFLRVLNQLRTELTNGTLVLPPR